MTSTKAYPITDLVLEQCDATREEYVMYLLMGGVVLNHNGSIRWSLNGSLHRIGGPASVDDSGRKGWYKNGYYHRLGGPAIIFENGEEAWYEEGRRVFPSEGVDA